MLIKQPIVAELVLESLYGPAVAHLLLELGLRFGGDFFDVDDRYLGLDIVDVIGDDAVPDLSFLEELLLGGELQVLNQLLH